MRAKEFYRLIGVIALFIVSGQIYAQMGKDDGSKYGKGEDSVRCVRNLSLFSGYAKNGEFDMAYTYWKIVFDECPKASKNTYINGVKMYKYFLGKETSIDRKNELADTLMLIYNRRIENFGEKGKVRGRQGTDLLKYKRQDGIEYLQLGYEYLKESIELRKNKTANPVLPTMLSASISLLSEEAIDAGQVISDYLLIIEIIDNKLLKKPDNKKLLELKANIDANFIKYGPGDCEKLVDYFSKEFEEKKNDIDFLTMLTNLLQNRECTSSKFYYTASKALDNLSPTPESAIKIAYWAKSNKLNNDAIEYYLKAIERESDEEKRSKYYMGIALAYQELNSKVRAKEYALKAAKAKVDYGEPYLLLGQLYANSLKDCEKIKLPNSVYWIAVDMFVKAKRIDPSVTENANQYISIYRKYFPNEEAAFFLGIKEGDTVFIDCWINESTKARF